MGNDTKVRCKGKDEESSDIKGSNIDSRSSSSLGAAYDTSGLRRSARETSLKKNMTPSPSSTQKSEHIEKQTPTTPLFMRKSERLVEKQCFSTPSRRSERAKNQSSSSSSGSKKSGKSSGSLVMKKKHKKEKSVQQLATEEVGNSDKPVIKTVLVGIKRMDARAYRELFKRKQKKAKLEGHCEEMKDKNATLSRGCGNNHIDGAFEDVDGGNECSRREVEELIDGCILRDPEKKFEGISIVSEPTKETLESNGVLKSPPKSQRLTFIQEACQFNEWDGREDLKSDDSVALSSHRPLSELSNNVAEMEKKKMQAELVDLIANRTPGVDTEVNNGYKVMPCKRKRSIDDLNFDAMEMVTNEDSEAASYECGRTDSVDQKKRYKVANNSTNSPSLKAALIGTSGAPVHNMSQVMPTSIGLLNTTDANHISNFTHLNSNLSQVLKANMAGYNLHDSEKSLHLFLKPEIAKLCEILQLPENVKVMVEQFLEYVLNNRHVSREPTSLLQAFLISLCWTASSMLKHKLDHKESLALAKEHLKFGCKKDEAEFVYSKLRCLKKVFLYRTGTFKVAGSPKAEDFSLKDVSKNQSNGRSSLSTPSNMQKVRMEVENLRSGQEFSIDQVLSHLGLAQKDYSKSIKCIETKCEKQMRKLLQRQQEEREKFEKKYEEEKAELVHMQRTEAAVIRLHRNSSPRTGTLKIVDNVYAKKFEELKRQMDMHLNNLLKLQLATRNKLQERKAQLIEGLKSWADAELINKPPANESGYNQENTVTLSSCSKEQTPEQAQSTPDGDVPLEVPETVSSNEDVFPGVLVASKPMSGGATSSMLDQEVPMEVPQTASVRDVSEDVVFVNSSPCEEQIPDVQITSRVSEANSCSDGSENTIHKLSSEEGSGRVALMMPDREFPLGVTEIVSSTGGLENDASVNPSPSDGQTSARTTSCMDGREVFLEVPETAPLEAEEAINTTMDKDGVTDMVSGNAIEEQIPDVQITLRVSEANSCSDGSEDTIHKSSSEEGSGRVALMMPDGEFPLLVTGIFSSTGGLENDASVNSSPSEGQTSARTTSCMDGREVLLEVPETVPPEAEDAIITTMDTDRVTGMVCGNAIEVDQQNGVVCILNQESLHDDIAAVNQQIGVSLLGAPVNNVVNQQDEVVQSGVCGTPFEVVVGSGTASRDNSGVRVTALSYGTGVDPQAVMARGFETTTGAEVGSGPIWREIDRVHTVALDSSQPTESSRLQDSGAQGCDNRIAFQQTDASASQPVVVASNQSPNDAPVMEHTLHLLPSTDSPTGLQPATSFAQHLPIDSIAVGGPRMHISNIRTAPVTSRISNHSATVPTVRMPVSMSQDPLQNELDRIRTETDQIIKIHEDTKLRQKSDCEKEIQEVITQIRRKYDIKLQDIESEFLRKRKEMDDNQNKVLMNKILADAFRTKCMDNKASSTPVRQQEMTSSVVQQLLQLSQPSTQRPILSGPYSTGLPAASLQTTPTSFPPAPPLQVAHCSALFSATPTRPPHISSISPTTSNLQVGTEIRAPAPHLQHLRPSASITATCPSSFPIGILQQVLTSPPTLSENPSLAPETVQQSGPRNTRNCHESMGTLPSRTSLSRLESLMDVDNQTRTDATQPCSFSSLTDLISNINPLASESEVVCLSDDD